MKNRSYLAVALSMWLPLGLAHGAESAGTPGSKDPDALYQEGRGLLEGKDGGEG